MRKIMNKDRKCPNCGHYKLVYENQDYIRKDKCLIARDGLRCRNCNILIEDNHLPTKGGMK